MAASVLHLEQRGEGKSIVFLHGFPLDHSMWREQLTFFSARYRVLAPDLPGFGRSQLPSDVGHTGTMSMERMADEVAATLDAAGVTEPVVLCGLSMGGYVAFQFWKKYASRLAGLVLCDTRAIADTQEAAATRMKMIASVERSRPEPAAEAMLPKLLAEAAYKEKPELVAELKRMMLAAPPDGICAALRGLASRPDVSSWLPTIETPTLVVVGFEDKISTAGEMGGFAEKIPNARFEVLTDAGHMSPMEAPSAFNSALSDFLARLGW